MRWLAATISLKVSAILPSRPSWSPAMRTEKSPTRMACKACRRSCSSDDPPLAASAISPGIVVAGAPFALASLRLSLLVCIISSGAARSARHEQGGQALDGQIGRGYGRSRAIGGRRGVSGAALRNDGAPCPQMAQRPPGGGASGLHRIVDRLDPSIPDPLAHHAPAHKPLRARLTT